MLPPEATRIDPLLRDIGISLSHQRLVYGEIQSVESKAFLVAELIGQHPDGVAGRFYGVLLRGVVLGEMFRPWAADSIGEVQWANGHWVQISAKKV